MALRESRISQKMSQKVAKISGIFLDSADGAGGEGISSHLQKVSLLHLNGSPHLLKNTFSI